MEKSPCEVEKCLQIPHPLDSSLKEMSKHILLTGDRSVWKLMNRRKRLHCFSYEYRVIEMWLQVDAA